MCRRVGGWVGRSAHERSGEPTLAVRPIGADPAALRAVTSLAEGADRIFAGQALGLGYSLCCPPPCRQAEFERDFQPPRSHQEGSLDEFRDLLDRARQGAGLVLYELDGDRSRVQSIYEAAASVLLNQSDLLVGWWNGRERHQVRNSRLPPEPMDILRALAELAPRMTLESLCSRGAVGGLTVCPGSPSPGPSPAGQPGPELSMEARLASKAVPIR